VFKQPLILLCIAASVFLLTCGIEQYYYLPQVPEINIRTEFTTSAVITLPSLTNYDYAFNYLIYYRIYTSGHDEPGTINTSSIRSIISSDLAGDYNAIYPNTDPTSTASGTPANTLFDNRKYFKLELEGVDIDNILSKGGGNVRISFPQSLGDYPELSFNDGTPYRLYRSGDLISPEPKGDRYFRNTADLRAFEKAISTINADVSARSGLLDYAYVSMYIVAKGIHTVQFTPIYSKPTHISIFKLPRN
jgi:hypothetical protein